jgi:magnesium-transporting ATPase (P-type)
MAISSFVAFQFLTCVVIGEVLYGLWKDAQTIWYKYIFLGWGIVWSVLAMLSAFVMCICIQELWKRQLKKKGRMDYGCFSVESR